MKNLKITKKVIEELCHTYFQDEAKRWCYDVTGTVANILVSNYLEQNKIDHSAIEMYDDGFDFTRYMLWDGVTLHRVKTIAYTSIIGTTGPIKEDQ